MTRVFPERLLPPLYRSRHGVAVALVWATAALVVGVQGWLSSRLGGRPADFGDALSRHLPLLLLWALVTPAVLGSARRFPVRRGGSLRPLVAHAFLGTLFIAGSNVAIRLPGLLPGGTLDGPGELLRSTADGLVRWYPLALVVYGLIVSVGHLISPPDDTGSGNAARPGGLPLLKLRTSQGTRLLRPEEVEWIEADGNYVRVHDAEGRTHRARHRLSALEERLAGEGFVRIHRSALVRLTAIRELRPLDRGDFDVVLRGGDRVRMPRTRRGDVEALLGVEL